MNSLVEISSQLLCTLMTIVFFHALDFFLRSAHFGIELSILCSFFFLGPLGDILRFHAVASTTHIDRVVILLGDCLSVVHKLVVDFV